MSYSATVAKFPQNLQMPMLELVEAVQQDLRAQLAVRREDIDRVWETIHALAQAQERTEQRVEELAQAQARTEQRLDRLEATVAELVEAQKRTEKILQALIVRVAKNTGKLLEIDYRDKAFAYFGTLLRKVRVIPLQDLEEALESSLTPEEFRDLLPLDLLVRGQVRQAAAPLDVYLAVEVSAVVDVGDIDRAMRRAGYLRKAGIAAIPTVAGEDATEGAEAVAQTRSVLLVQDGLKRNWAAALREAGVE